MVATIHLSGDADKLCGNWGKQAKYLHFFENVKIISESVYILFTNNLKAFKN